jgi:hypothetical protein
MSTIRERQAPKREMTSSGSIDSDKAPTIVA